VLQQGCAPSPPAPSVSYTFGVLCVNVVEFTLGIAGHRTVGCFLVIAQGTDGGIGTILGEMLVHFVQLTADPLIPGIRQRHVDVVRHHTLLWFIFAVRKLGYLICQEYDGKQDDQRKDVLGLFQIQFLHLCCPFSKLFTISSSCLYLLTIIRESSCVLGDRLTRESSSCFSTCPFRAIALSCTIW